MLPDFVIIGAQKCGTTSLHYYLSLHPAIGMSKIKETNFFIEEYNWNKGIEWYKSLFKGKAEIYGEASPNYTNYPKFKSVPKRMHALIPNAKLIYLVKDPVERFVSQYLGSVASCNESRSIEEVINDENIEESEYVYRSKYCFQLEQFLEYYPQRKILLVANDKLKNERKDTLKRIFQFLGVDDTFESEKIWVEKGASLQKIKTEKKTRKWIRYLLSDDTAISKIKKYIPSKTKQKLKDFLLSHGEKLERPLLTREQRNKLSEFFREDIEKMNERWAEVEEGEVGVLNSLS